MGIKSAFNGFISQRFEYIIEELIVSFFLNWVTVENLASVTDKIICFMLKYSLLCVFEDDHGLVNIYIL